MPKSKSRITKQESDGSYLLKLVLYVIIGSQWLWISASDDSTFIPLPIGLIIGLLFVRHERFQIDRKIEYALLLIATLIGFWAQIGLFIR